MKPGVRFHIRDAGAHPDLAIGPGKVALLEAIRDTGSITAAARRLGMSYRRAWLLVDAMNQAFTSPVVETAKGGPLGGKSVVTPLGAELVLRYRALERETAVAVRRRLRSVLRAS